MKMKCSNVRFLLGVCLGCARCSITKTPIANTSNQLNDVLPSEISDNHVAPRTSFKKRPLKIFLLLKELGSGWKNKQIPPLVTRNATGTRSLVLDVGLHTGNEFFAAVDHGFEVVGFEPNPDTFPNLSAICQQKPKCQVLDLDAVTLPLQREEGYPHLVNAAVGKELATLQLNIEADVSSLVQVKGLQGRKTSQVKVVKMDDFIKEDVCLFKIDTQGCKKFVLEGSKDLFENHVVRQVILEVDPFTMAPNDITVHHVLGP